MEAVRLEGCACPSQGSGREPTAPWPLFHHILVGGLVSLRVWRVVARGPCCGIRPQGSKSLLCHSLPHDPVPQFPHLYKENENAYLPG